MAVAGSSARVSFLDSREERDVDIAALNVRRGSYVEVFASSAIGVVSKKEAEQKGALRRELMRRLVTSS